MSVTGDVGQLQVGPGAGGSISDGVDVSYGGHQAGWVSGKQEHKEAPLIRSLGCSVAVAGGQACGQLLVRLCEEEGRGVDE